jgi:hypothetical protein
MRTGMGAVQKAEDGLANRAFADTIFRRDTACRTVFPQVFRVKFFFNCQFWRAVAFLVQNIVFLF